MGDTCVPNIRFTDGGYTLLAPGSKVPIVLPSVLPAPTSMLTHQLWTRKTLPPHGWEVLLFVLPFQFGLQVPIGITTQLLTRPSLPGHLEHTCVTPLQLHMDMWGPPPTIPEGSHHTPGHS